jgi:transposase
MPHSEDDFIMSMKRLEYSNREIARKLGVSEGAIRYHIKRRCSGKEDGRKHKPSCLDPFFSAIELWIEDYRESRRRPTLKTLYTWLKRDHGYQHSYDAFRRYVRKHFPELHKKGSWVRIETPPGVLLFVDWKEDVLVQMWEPGHWVKVQFLCFTLGFSRKMVVRVTERKDLSAFIHSHQKALCRLGGLPEVIRTDCLKSAVVKWQGERSVLTEGYQRYLGDLVVDAFPSRPGMPEDKGKVEKRIRDLFSGLDFKHRVFKDMADLQRKVDKELVVLEKEWRCGATGLTVAESFAYERDHLRALPVHFPSIPLKEKRTTVRKDGTVYFDRNYYQLEGGYRDRSVLCINTGEEITIYYQGDKIGHFPYLPGTKGMVMLSKQAVSGGDNHLSETVRRWALTVARRQVQIYQEIIHRRSA